MQTSDQGRSAQNKSFWSVVVFYEDSKTRVSAVHFCDRLVKRFWREKEFDIHWCSFSKLGDQAIAEATSRKAEKADILVFSMLPKGAMTGETMDWIEKWLCTRAEHEGVLVGLLSGEGFDVFGCEKHIYLRNLAHRLSMDYWTEIPEHLSRAIPDSLESYSARADRVTHVLDEILHHSVLPPGMRA